MQQTSERLQIILGQRLDKQKNLSQIFAKAFINLDLTEIFAQTTGNVKICKGCRVIYKTILNILINNRLAYFFKSDTVPLR